jgi:hypothetical protein
MRYNIKINNSLITFKDEIFIYNSSSWYIISRLINNRIFSIMIYKYEKDKSD